MKSLLLALLITLLTPIIAFAHQPRLIDDSVDTTYIQVADPEISKAYYGDLTGTPHIYRINSNKPFELYVNILVPNIDGQSTDLTVTITAPDGTLTTLDGENFTWTEFWEPFGYDSYFKGPEYTTNASAGSYKIKVEDTHNQGKYSLAIGQIEAFNFKETINAITLIPQIKHDFFNESPANFIFSPFGIGYIFMMYVLAFIFGFIYRTISRKCASKILPAKKIVLGPPHNIGKKDRFLRAILGALLLILAITTSWSVILIFFSGFCMFEALFSWCAFYQLIGKNSCPIN